MGEIKIKGRGNKEVKRKDQVGGGDDVQMGGGEERGTR